MVEIVHSNQWAGNCFFPVSLSWAEVPSALNQKPPFSITAQTNNDK